MKTSLKTLIISIFTATLSVYSHAATWNLAEDFSMVSNPSGAWSYGTAPVPGGAVNLFGIFGSYDTAHVQNGSVAMWLTADPGLDGKGDPPLIGKVVGGKGGDARARVYNGSYTCYVKQRNQGVFTVGGAAPVVATWTAPAEGDYFINATFYPAACEVGNPGASVYVYVKGVAVFNGSLAVGSVTALQDWSTQGFKSTSQISSLVSNSVHLMANEKVQFIVNTGAAVGIDAVIRNVNTVVKRTQ